MFDRIVLPVSESSAAAAALARVRPLADDLSCPLTLLNVVDEAGDVGAGERMLGGLLVDSSVPAESVSLVEVGDPAATILAVAGTYDRPLIAMPSRAAGPVAEALFGSVTRQVVREGGHPMLVMGPSCASVEAPEAGYRRLVVCLDGSPPSSSILPVAKQLAMDLQMSVLLLHVIYPLEPMSGEAYLSREDREMYDRLANTAEEWKSDGLDVAWNVEQGTWPSQTIVDGVVRRADDLIAMATHGRTALVRMLTGSVTAEVVKSAPVPVLTLRPTHLLH